MKERPILFSGEMVRAILDGRKTMTRRVIKPQPDKVDGFTGKIWAWEKTANREYTAIKCPYGSTGDRLWVMETFANLCGKGFDNEFAYKASTSPDGDICRIEYGIKWKPSIHMPRSASRITLEITNIRVERVQDITREDSIAEGITEYGEGFRKEGDDQWRNRTSIENFATLWDSINAKRGYSWYSNPWVWVVEFRRI